MIKCAVIHSAMGTVVVDGHIYVCGGYDGKSSLNSVECFSPETDRCSNPLSTGVSGPGPSPDLGPQPGSGTGPESGPQPVAGLGSGPGQEPGPEPGSGPGCGSGTFFHTSQNDNTMFSLKDIFPLIVDKCDVIKVFKKSNYY